MISVSLRFKAAKDESKIKAKRAEREAQIISRGYAAPYRDGGRPVQTGVFVIDVKNRRAV